MKSISVALLAFSLSAQNVLAQSASKATPPVETQNMAGSNIGLTAYPALPCTKPQLDLQQPIKEVKKDTTNYLVGVKGPVTGVNDDESAEDHNAQVKKYNETAKAYNAQIAAYYSCVQTYTANASADLRRIRNRLEAAVLGGALTSPSGAQAAEGSNIGMIDYPASTCVKPSEIDPALKPGSVPPLEAKVPEIDAYNLRVKHYNTVLNTYNDQTAGYNSCIQIYSDNSKADLRRIQAALDAAAVSAKSDDIKTVPATESKNIDSPAKNFAEAYGAPGLQINKIL